MAGFGHDHSTPADAVAVEVIGGYSGLNMGNIADRISTPSGGRLYSAYGSFRQSSASEASSPPLTSFTHTHDDGTVETHFFDPTQSHNHGPAQVKLPGMSSNYTQHNGTTGSDRIIGGAGDDFIFPGEGTFRFNKALSGEEFPFATPSDSVTELELSLDSKGNFKVAGAAAGLDGAPLFSQGETVIDPNAIILNGSDPDALVQGFLSVPEDVEGNPLSGVHLHFSPAGESTLGSGSGRTPRGDFADATVVRFFNTQVTGVDPSGISASIDGSFNLNPIEQAALLAGNLYVNLHTNVDLDGDGNAGFPTGENRINLNQNVVEFV